MNQQNRNQSIFEQIKQNPDFHQKNAINWFKKIIKELGDYDKAALLRTTKDIQTSRLFPGAMNFYVYDPKTKEKLPYYDKFPLVLIIGITDKGFSGINFHYLPIPIRIKLYEKIDALSKMKKYSQQRILQLTWETLLNASRFPEVRPAIKQYLFGHIRSRIIKVPLEDWKTALMLPNEDFAKVSTATVHRISAASLSRRPSRRAKGRL